MNKYELYFTFSIIIISPTPTETETVLLHVMPNLSRHAVRVLSLRSSVIHGFVTEPWYSRHVRVSCERAASSVLVHSLSSAYLVSCWSVVFGSRHSCLEFRFLVGVRTLALRFLCECAVSSSLGCALSCPRVFCCVARSSFFYRLRAFMLYIVLCGTQLVYFIGCMLSHCHVLCEHVAYEISH